MQKVARVFLVGVIGALGGLVCGFILFSIQEFAGWTGSTGEPAGVWHPDVQMWFALAYAVPVGTVASFIAGATILRRTPIRRSAPLAAAGTLIGGLAGAPLGPMAVLLTSIIGFSVACWSASRPSLHAR